MVTELTTQYDSRASFYSKATMQEFDGDLILTSYSTIVAYINDYKTNNASAVINGLYSATTTRHIKEFLKQNGFKAENSKQIMKDYGVN